MDFRSKSSCLQYKNELFIFLELSLEIFDANFQVGTGKNCLEANNIS